jgi:hypothetical protein
MTTVLVFDYIARRMKELGHGDCYFTRLRHFMLRPGERMEIPAFNQIFMLTDTCSSIITSEFGQFNLLDQSANEQLYEHSGRITIENRSSELSHIQFIQVIPKHN